MQKAAIPIPDRAGATARSAASSCPRRSCRPLEELETGLRRGQERSGRSRRLCALPEGLRGPADAALLRRTLHRDASAARRSTSSAKTSPTPARTRSTTPSARCSSRKRMGKTPHHRRDRRRPARRRHGHRRGAVRPRMRRLHGHGGHASGRRSTSSACGCSAPRSSPSTPGSRRSRTPSTRRCATGSRTSRDTHYILGTVLGPHPVPADGAAISRRVIGREARAQILEQEGPAARPARSRASAAAATPSASSIEFLDDDSVRMIGVEAGGHGISTRPARGAFRTAAAGRAARHDDATCCRTTTARSWARTASRRASTTPSVGPEHAYLHDTGRVEYTYATDDEALDAFAAASAGSKASSPRSKAPTPSPTPARSCPEDAQGPTSSSSTSPAAATKTSNRPPNSLLPGEKLL